MINFSVILSPLNPLPYGPSPTGGERKSPSFPRGDLPVQSDSEDRKGNPATLLLTFKGFQDNLRVQRRSGETGIHARFRT
jgi:hypothetical protein